MSVDYGELLAGGHDKDRARRIVNGELIADILFDYFKPRTAIDLGCGLGFVLRALKGRGVAVTGVEGEWVATAAPEIERDDYILADLNEPFSVNDRFDLALSLEVAEHLKPERSEAFVDELCALSDTILFSAAIPGQGGYGHINPKFQDEWAALFAERDYKCYDPVRRQLAQHDVAFNWFTQNILLFVKEGRRVKKALAAHEIAPQAAAYVSKTQYNRRIRGLKKKVAELEEQLKAKAN